MIRPKESVCRAHAYVPGEQPTDRQTLKLNTNENPYPPSPRVMRAVRALEDRDLALYPNANADPLRERLAHLFGLSRDHFLIGNGSDENLRHIFETYLSKGDSIGVLHPTYTLYETLAGLFGVETLSYSLRDDLRPPEAFYRAPVKALFVPSPNPPYGVPLERGEIERLLQADPRRLLVLDEAYIDFSTSPVIREIDRFANLIITRTFSKSFSMAGVRLGFACAVPELIAHMAKVKDSYNINVFTQTAGAAALDDLAVMRAHAERIVTTRERLRRELSKLGLESTPSQGNFLFVFFAHAQALYEALKQRHIYVRYFDRLTRRPGVRITIGTEEQTDRLLTAVREILPDLISS